MSAVSHHPLFTPSTLNALIERWCTLPTSERRPPSPRAGDVVDQARLIVARTMGSYADYMSPADRDLYAQLIALPDPAAWRRRFFECFDLMARTRGAAIAVLRLHDLHRLLVESGAAHPPDARRAMAVAA